MVVGEDGIILKTTDGGQNWGYQIYGQYDISNVWLTTSATGIATAFGKIIRTTDKGLSWNLITDIYETITCIDFVDSVNGYCVGYNSTFIKTEDGGINWSSDTEDQKY